MSKASPGRITKVVTVVVSDYAPVYRIRSDRCGRRMVELVSGRRVIRSCVQIKKGD